MSCPRGRSTAQAERMAPLDLVAMLVSDELQRRQDRLFECRHKQAGFRDVDKGLDGFHFDFNRKMNRALVFDPATAAFVGRREDALFLGPPGTGKSHLAQAIGRAAIHQGYRVLYREPTRSSTRLPKRRSTARAKRCSRS
jgi:DNA replication protein DnaC